MVFVTARRIVWKGILDIVNRPQPPSEFVNFFASSAHATQEKIEINTYRKMNVFQASNHMFQALCRLGRFQSKYNPCTAYRQMSALCEALTRKGTPCKNRATTGALCCKTHAPASASAGAVASAGALAPAVAVTPSPATDPYTFEALKDRLEAFLACCRQVIAFKAKYGVRGVRMPIMDEDISENIIKFIIQFTFDRAIKSGILLSGIDP